MSINAISSVSLYEYYYTINKKEEKETSPLAKEMKKYGLVPTDNEQINIAMLERAKRLEASKNNENVNKPSNSDRPWADIMYQLNISFNDDPKDDIEDIKEKLNFLLAGIEDKELETEINDLVSYVEKLYLDFNKISSTGGIDKSLMLSTELNNLSVMNRATLF